jgi:hypothetical protein
MRLLYPQNVPQPLQGLVCRQSRLSTFLFTVLFLAMTAAVPAVMFWQARIWWWLSAVVIVIVGWFAKILLVNVWRTMRSTNWLLYISPDCLWINIRSYANCDFAPAATVIQLPYEEIAHVRELIVKRAERNHEGNATWRERSLEIRLLSAVPDQVAAEIAEERRRRAGGIAFFGAVTFSHRTDMQSVTAPEKDLIRVAWRTRTEWITPSLRRVFEALEGHVTIAAAETRDDSHADQMSGEELDRLILRSLESSDRMGALKLLQQSRGLSTTDAHRFVEELSARI